MNKSPENTTPIDDQTLYTYLVGYCTPQGTFGREFLTGPSAIATPDDVTDVETYLRAKTGEPRAMVLSVSLLSIGGLR